MSLSLYLQKIEQQQLQIGAEERFSEEVLKRVNYKFRLDWNFYSNAMEGNTLTEKETRSVMINNITLEGKPLKDVLEMKGHDEVITEILKIGKSEIRLSEKRIKEIHKAIMREDDPEQQKKIGIWKKENNYLYNYQNERFDFLPVDEVPEAMHNLHNWINAELDKVYNGKISQLEAVVLAFEFHIRYIAIHPFYDGNGRTARIFMNLLLISLGFPP
ncbi:MAG: Fic family protein, partial [Opitutaceae bacterium]|nr:Fic family protein [Cytophagales bacterium]